MVAYQEGDDTAFNELYDRASDKVYGYLLRRLPSREVADEVFQNTWIKFHQLRFRYRAPLPVLPWLFTICRTVMIDCLRQQARRSETFEENMDAFQDNFSAPKTGDDLTFSDGIAGFKILNSSQKEALALRYQEDLSFEDIAQRLQTTPVNVRQLISRALKKLRSFADRKGKIK